FPPPGQHLQNLVEVGFRLDDGGLGQVRSRPSAAGLAASRPASPSPLEPLEPAGLAASAPEDTSPLERILQFRITSREIGRKVGTAAAQNVENRAQACVFFHTDPHQNAMAVCERRYPPRRQGPLVHKHLDRSWSRRENVTDAQRQKQGSQFWKLGESKRHPSPLFPAAYPISTPMRRTRSLCCARATSGHAAAAPPSSVMKSRRFIRSPSAVASSVGGTSMPSALAVLRLMTNSNLVACCTGMSIGFAPLRMFPA